MTDWYGAGDRRSRMLVALQDHGFDALLALTPENAHYLAGHRNFVATHWRLPGLFSVVVNRNGDKGVVSGEFGVDPAVTNRGYAHFPYTSWTESIDLRGHPGATASERIVAARANQVPRPAQFDLDEVVEQIRIAIETIAASARRVGADLSQIDRASFQRLESRLPQIEFVDATTVFDDLRTIKDSDEVDALRLACELTEIGIAGAVDRLRPGLSELAVNSTYHIAVQEAAAREARFAGFQQAEGVATVGFGGTTAQVVGPGETIKFDMQVDFAGYHSDIGRTVAYQPTSEQRQIFAALRQSLNAMTAAVKPAISFADLFQIGAASMHDQGFANYSRGHLGHSDGLTQHFEEPPFIAPDENRQLRERMVLSLEMPYYVYGIGAFQLERMVLVTAGSCETLDHLPFDLELTLRD